MTNPPDYKGQPRKANGQLNNGKQNGSKDSGRGIGATANRPQIAGVWAIPPYDKPKPKNKPEEQA